MSYLNYVIENEAVGELTDSHQETISAVIESLTQRFIEVNFTYVIENIDRFAREVNSDIYALYESIRDFIVQDYITMVDAVTEVCAADESFDIIADIIHEDASDVFTGLGYGAQFSHRLIEMNYEPEDE